VWSMILLHTLRSVTYVHTQEDHYVIEGIEEDDYILLTQSWGRTEILGWSCWLVQLVSEQNNLGGIGSFRVTIIMCSKVVLGNTIDTPGIAWYISYSVLYPRQQPWFNCVIHQVISLIIPLSCNFYLELTNTCSAASRTNQVGHIILTAR